MLQCQTKGAAYRAQLTDLQQKYNEVDRIITAHTFQAFRVVLFTRYETPNKSIPNSPAPLRKNCLEQSSRVKKLF